MNKNVTIVTGLWDLGRGSLNGWAKRDFDHYKNKFYDLLKVDAQMCIWIPQELEEEVIAIRENKPTKIFIKNINDFKSWNPFFEKIQEIRQNPNWKNFAGWLTESPQASLEFYNPMMFTKMFMVNDSAVINPFNSDYFFWIDGGIYNTVNPGYFTHDKVFDNLDNYVLQHNNKFIQISYPYEANSEIHGFERTSLARYCNTDFVNYVCRGGFFGGNKETIHKINSLYYGIMESTLKEGLMGADECLFTILSYRHSDITHRFEISGNGLIWPFFEELKEYSDEKLMSDPNFSKKENTALYVITFNSPNQFETLIQSIIQYDVNFLDRPKKYLLDNSSDTSTTNRYIELCDKYNFTHIKKNNLGICGGRQWIAEHADENNFDYYFFFEDDMFFYTEKNSVCRNGFNRYVPDFYNKILDIMKMEKFDFLKLNYSEFYGDNGTQWSWYNVPQSFREQNWPNNKKLPTQGLDPNAPKTKYNKIVSYKGVPYTNGEVYYCNWPQVVSNIGNKKMFLNTKWERPHEQTWMSHMYQLTLTEEINPGLILMTPTEHDRFEHYDGKLRKES